MKVAMAVSSRSGNTRRLAEAVADALRSRGADVVSAEDGLPGDIDAVAAGFWTDKGDCAEDMREFLETLRGMRVVLFGTAGFGGSPEYFDRILANVASHLPGDAELAGGAMCQGRMGDGVRRRYEAMLAENPGDARIQGMIDNFDAALSHPDEDDLERVSEAVAAALGLPSRTVCA